MRCEHKTVLMGELKGTSYDKETDIYGIKLKNIEFCCDKMEKAFKEEYIGFGEFDCLLNRDSNINIYRCHPYPEGACWDEMAIKFCPFCGEKIETVEVERARLESVSKKIPSKIVTDFKEVKVK